MNGVALPFVMGLMIVVPIAIPLMVVLGVWNFTAVVSEVWYFILLIGYVGIFACGIIGLVAGSLYEWGGILVPIVFGIILIMLHKKEWNLFSYAASKSINVIENAAARRQLRKHGKSIITMGLCRIAVSRVAVPDATMQISQALMALYVWFSTIFMIEDVATIFLDYNMGVDTEDFCSEFFGETCHDGKDADKRHNPDGNACHRDDRDQGNKALFAFCL